MNKNSLAVFEDYKIRRIYDEESETWYFSVVDIIQVLIQQPDYQTARKYWNKLKLEAADGKKYLTDVAGTETLLRLIQSVPSPKAEPIKKMHVGQSFTLCTSLSGQRELQGILR